MKIAVASNSGMVTEHFRHCESFNIFETQNSQIINHESILNPGHKLGFLPNLLNEIGVNVIISGGMGSDTIEIFIQKGIEVITGAKGHSLVAVEEYLEGKLKTTDAVCDEHHGESGH